MSLAGDSIACKDAEVMWKVWNRMNRGEIVDLLNVWGEYPAFLNSSRRKKEMLHTLVNHIYADGLTHKQIADIDLMLFERRKEDIEWEVHTFASEEETIDRLSNDPVELERSLRSSLDVFFPHFTIVRLVEGKYLIRIEVWDGVPYDKDNFDFDASMDESKIFFLDIPRKSQVMYCVYIPHSTNLFLTPVAGEYLECILESLYSAFGMHEFGKVDISGKSVDSLAALILQQQAQGIYASFQPSQKGQMGQDGPIQEIQGFRSRMQFGSTSKELIPVAKREAVDGSDGANVTTEDDIHQERKDIALMEAFGGQLNSLPILQNVKYYVAGASGFHSETIPNVNGRFRMRVQLEGPHVLDGLRECVKLNIIELPLSQNLALISSAGRNEFIIDEERAL